MKDETLSAAEFAARINKILVGKGQVIKTTDGFVLDFMDEKTRIEEGQMSVLYERCGGDIAYTVVTQMENMKDNDAELSQWEQEQADVRQEKSKRRVAARRRKESDRSQDKT